MSRRGDNIHKRKDGRWEGRYKSGVDKNGKTLYKSVYAKTYSDCKLKLEQTRSEQMVPMIKYSVFRFKEILTLWLDSNRIRLKGSTIMKYEYLIDNHINPELGNYKVNDLSSFIINAFLDKKLNCGSKLNNDNLSPSYVRTIAIIIESAINYGAREELCLPLKNPINKPTLTNRELEVLTQSEQKEIESKLSTDDSKVALGTIIALHTGLRIGEICALHWNDVDLSNNLIYVNYTVSREKATEKDRKTKLVLVSPKTRTSKRIVPISSFLKSILADAFQADTFVVSNTNTFVDTRTFDYQFKKLFRSYNLECICFHTIRHTFATRCLQSGMDVKTLSEKITYKDDTTEENKIEFGVKGKVGAEAYLAQGNISGGITIYGIKIDAGVQKKFGGVGVTTGSKVTTSGVSGEVSAGLGLGTGVEISIDWSDVSL